MQKFKFDWTDSKKKMAEAPVNGGFKKDERIYSPEFGKNGTVNVLMRFLPPMRDAAGLLCDADFPYVGPVYYHNISEHKKWMNVNCPTSIGLACPICECNREHWDEYDKTQQKRSRKVNYFSNVLILKDHVHPENEGKVFIFRFGKKIFDKMAEKSNPPADSLVSQADYWDYYQGANFKLIIKKVKSEANKEANNDYASCCFEDSLTPIAPTDEAIEAIMNKCYKIKPFIAESNFESYDAIAKKFSKFTTVHGTATASTPAPAEDSSNEDVTPDIGEVTPAEDADDIFSKIKDED
jgi:hypothetical protein